MISNMQRMGNKLFKKHSTLKSYYTGGRFVYDKLIQHKVKDAFIYSGGAVMPLVDCFYNNKSINYYIGTNELSMGLSAVGYAKSSGKPGICIVTSGPGLTNTLTAMTDAQNDSTPLIVLSGQVPVIAMGSSAFQECPAIELSKSITKWNYCIQDSSEISDVLDEAFKISQDGRPGCVHIDLPKCVLSNIVEPTTGKKINNALRAKMINTKNPNDIDDEFMITIKYAAKLINNAKKPVLYVGKGAINSSKELTKLAKKCNIPVTTTLHALGVFDENEALSLEMVGMHGSVTANKCIQKSDLIIAVGSRFDDRTTGVVSKYAPNAKVIHINIDETEKDKVIKSDIFINKDTCLVLKYLKNHAKKNTSSGSWLYYIKSLKIKYPFAYEITKTLKTQDVLIETNKQLKKYEKQHKSRSHYITTGVGNHQMMAAQYIKWKRPGSIITSGSLGVMGAGLPYAIGCQIANPDSLVIDIDGDGSFNMTAMELVTIKRYNLPIKIFIMNNGKQDMVRVWEDLFYSKRFTATNLPNNPDYVKFSESFGIKAITCNSKKELSKVIKEAINYPGPVVVNFVTEPDYCLPLVAPGKSLDEVYNFQDNDLSKFNSLEFKNVLPPN